MNRPLNRREWIAGATLLTALPSYLQAGGAKPIAVESLLDPPEWALLQRELLNAHTDACEAFHQKYFDDRNYLRAVERWGTNDGPDDAIEAVNDWAHLHALGGSDRILTLYRDIWEGHLRQYTRARTREVPSGRKGMYVREFPPQLDWQHISEGLSTFNLMGLSTPNDAKLIARTRRFASLYTGEDRSAPNYDAAHRIIRSLFNGSLGPLMRPTTALDWAGDWFDVTKFKMEHGERSYEETLAHYKDYVDTVGDNPLNLQATVLALNAFALTGESRYRDWLVSYVDAWAERATSNGGIIPSNIGLDGKIGGAANGKWYGGVYGWGFSPVVPQSGEREDRNRVPRSIVGFLNAYLLTGDDRYLEVWRKQTAVINEQAKFINGTLSTPRMFGDNGWYSYTPGPYRFNEFEIWYFSMRADDRERAGNHPWVSYLEGKKAGYPVEALRASLARIRKKIAAMREDTTTPETRLADNPIAINPVSVVSLIQLTQGGIHIARPPWSPTSPQQGGAPLYCRVRHFDPEKRRAGLPQDVAVLVDSLSAVKTGMTVVNLSPVDARLLTVQGGAYAEHRIDAVTINGKREAVSGSALTVQIAPGCGARLELEMTRFVNRPTLAFPWAR